MVLGRRRRHFERYIEIGRILARHGWDFLLGRLGLADLFHVRQQELGAPPGPAEVRETLEELGPTFIKLGQLLSTRPDIIPREYATELEKLQDKAPPVPYSQIQKVIEEEFCEPICKVFATFDPEPLASASLGQAHFATLHDGQEVVVKVQRPDIIDTVNTDIEILDGIARFLEQHYPQLRVYGLPDLVDEFSISIHQEMDYTKEGKNLDRFRENFAEVHQIRFPKTIWDFTTVFVLTMERLCGVKISDVDELDAKGYDRPLIAKSLSRAFLKMVFIDGFFHSDPHPGNLVVLENNAVGILDCGQVGRLDAHHKEHVNVLLNEYIYENSPGFAEALLDMGTTPSDLDRKEFIQDIDRFLRQYYNVPVSDVRIGEILSQSMEISAKYGVRLPASIAMLAKAVLEVESVNRLLDPNYNLRSDAREFIERAIRDELTVGKIRTLIMQNLLSWKKLLIEFPHRSAEVLESMAENRFRIIFKHEGLEEASRDIDQSANRLSLALLASATIIASAQVLSSKVGPLWHGYPVIGIVGFGLAFLFVVSLMISIIRGGNLW